MALTIANRRDKGRELMSSIFDVKSKEASPDLLVLESKWIECEQKFENYLLNIMEINGFLLSYIIRKNNLPYRVGPYAGFCRQND